MESNIDHSITNPLNDDGGMLGELICERYVYEAKDQENPKSGLYLINLDTGSEYQLSLNDDYSPKWSPDGKKIAFVSYRDGNGDIYIMEKDGSSQTQLTTDPQNDNLFNWSPDGNFIVFTSTRDGNSELYLLNVNLKTIKRLTYTEEYESTPEFSPNGNKIAFTSFTPDEGYQIFIMNSDGTDKRQITKPHTSNYYSPIWCPNEDCLIYITDLYNQTETYRRLILYDFESNDEKFLLDGYFDNQGTTYEWFSSRSQKEGKILIWLFNDEVNNLYVLEMDNHSFKPLDIEGGTCDLFP